MYVFNRSIQYVLLADTHLITSRPNGTGGENTGYRLETWKTAVWFLIKLFWGFSNDVRISAFSFSYDFNFMSFLWPCVAMVIKLGSIEECVETVPDTECERLLRRLRLRLVFRWCSWLFTGNPIQKEKKDENKKRGVAVFSTRLDSVLRCAIVVTFPEF